MEVSISFPHDGKDGSTQTMIYNLTPADLEAVRLQYLSGNLNPPADLNMMALKVVGALLHRLNSSPPNGGERAAALARTKIQEAVFWGVNAGTVGL